MEEFIWGGLRENFPYLFLLVNISMVVGFVCYKTARYYSRFESMEDNVSTLTTDVAEVKKDLATNIAEVRKDLATSIADVRKDLATSIADVRKDLATSIAEVRKDLATNISDVRKELATNMTDIRKELSDNMTDIRKELAAHREETKTQFGEVNKQLTAIASYLSGKGLKPETFGANSPITLSEVGWRILNDTGGKRYVDENKMTLVKMMERKQLKSALDVQDYAMMLIIEVSSETNFTDIKNYIFQNPVYKMSEEHEETLSLLLVAKIIGIYLRDKYFEEHREDFLGIQFS